MQTTRFILKVIKPFAVYIAGAFFVTFLYVLDYTIIKPYLIKLLIDGAASNDMNGALAVLWMVAPYFCFTQMMTPFGWAFYDWCNLHYVPAIKNNISKTLFQDIIQHHYSFFQNNLTGNITSKITDVVATIPTLLDAIIKNYFASMLSILLGICTLWRVHPWFAVSALACFFVCVLVSIGTTHYFTVLSNITAEKVSRIIGNISDVLMNILNVRLFSARKHELARLKVLQEDYIQASQKRRRGILKLYLTQGIFFGIYQCVCVYLLIHFYKKGRITPGDFSMILTVNLWIFDGLWDIADQLHIFNEGWGTLTQALHLFYTQDSIIDVPQAPALILRKGSIEFKNVTFAFSGSETLFNNLSVKIEAGQKIGLVGFSGAGKTTFIQLMLRLYDIQKGEILIDGQNSALVQQESLRNAFSIITQDSLLFHRTLLENIQYAKPNATLAEIEQVCKKAAANDFIDHLPGKYDYLVGERGGKVSGGQRQRISIARALLKNAPIFVLDEATSSLDSVTETAMLDNLWPHIEGKTTLIIAHRLSTLVKMDRILVFDKGHIVEDGTHAELIKNNKLYAQLWDLQNCHI